MVKIFRYMIVVSILLFLGGCISITNETVDGAGTPDITECSSIPGVLDGKDFVPQSAISSNDDNRTHPDIFYIAWAELNDRIDLRSPEKGYDNSGFEDKLLVSRRDTNGAFKTWQLYPKLDNDCKDVEKVRIQSFDIAPDGQSLYVAMSKPVFASSDVNKTNDLNPSRKLGIFKLDINTQKLTPISNDYSVSYSYPTYIGNDPNTDHEILLIAKTVTKSDIPINYKEVGTLRDEYDRRETTLIHKIDTVTKSVTRIGFNNSHQIEPTIINRENNTPLVVFTQWEHQASVNRFSLWKMQIDGSDNFMFFGEEASTHDTSDNLYSARQIKSGKYKGYILMGQAGRVGNSGKFLAEGDILMAKRDNLDLRSDKIILSKIKTADGVEKDIARTPEHYNDESFVYSYRENTDSSYKIYIKDYPTDLSSPVDDNPGVLVMKSNDYHFMQPRSFYPPATKKVAPGTSNLSENRVSFTNNNLNGNSGFVVNTLGFSSNGEQHQLNGIDTNELRMQFQIPSHYFSYSNAIGMEKSQELSIPSSKFIKPYSDGSMGVILKEGLYIWKIHKKFEFTDGSNTKSDLWIPIRVERQEVSFVANRVNQCNQCHQERSQAILDKYENYTSIAETKMKGNLADVIGTDNDISDYNATKNIPNFYKDIVPLLSKTGLNGGKSCIDCHNSTDKLNLSNKTGVSPKNMTYRNLVLGAHKVKDSETILPYLYSATNPMGMESQYHPAPFLWSLLLNDDLTVVSDSTHPNKASRTLERSGDYGAEFRDDVNSEIARINGIYDHSKHWNNEDMQKFISYSTNRLAVGLSDKIVFEAKTLKTDTPQAQKAYQALVRNCYDCHNTHTVGGTKDKNFASIIPKEKRFTDSTYLQDSIMRFSIHQYLGEKGDTKYSQYLWQSNIKESLTKTLNSAMYLVNFDDIDNSEILVYARGYAKDNGTHIPLNDTIKPHSGYLSESDPDYIAIKNWLTNTTMTNQSPTLHNITAPITLKEYDTPAFIGEELVWSDDDNELSQLFISKSSSSEHIFNDSMLALEYQSLVSAKLKAYAMLGDRGEHNFTFSVSDGLDSTERFNVPVTITTDYNIPAPSSKLPKSYLFFTDRATGMLKKLDSNGTEIDIGLIDGFNASEWTTVYRRADKGWLYFINQKEQKIYVVDETDATTKHTITLDHKPNKEGASHKQTLYLIWWRPAEGEVGDANYSAGELQGLLESKLSSNPKKNGDFYVGLGSGETTKTIIPEWRTKLTDGANTLDVYVWRRATFMTKLINGGVDRMNALNLVTGKPKYLTDFNFTAQTVDNVDYNASEYFNVRAIVVAEDGAFYGFNQDLNQLPQAFSFDPLLKIQTEVIPPKWLKVFISNYTDYATPFFVVEKRELK